jgi:hypothetical protein
MDTVRDLNHLKAKISEAAVQVTGYMLYVARKVTSEKLIGLLRGHKQCTCGNLPITLRLYNIGLKIKC